MRGRAGRRCGYTSCGSSPTDVTSIACCVRTVSYPPKPGASPWFTRTRRSRSMLREVV